MHPLPHRFAALCAAALLVLSCSVRTEKRLTVVASTALVASAVEAVGADLVRVHTIAPAGMCPGHFDLRPADIAAANQARLLLNQGWEGWFGQLERAVTSQTVERITCKTQGNWMLPAVHKAAIQEIAGILARIDSAHAGEYRTRAQAQESLIDSAAIRVKSMFAGRQLPKVIAAAQQEPFLVWLGFGVVATYGRPEEFTARELARLALVAADSSVGLLVDNLQSGPDAGKALAEAHGARHITLTNFPLHGSYCRSLLDNARALAQALEPWNP